MVFVREEATSSEEGSGVEHTLQNRVSWGFSELHLGHFIPIVPSTCFAKGYQFILKQSNLMSVISYVLISLLQYFKFLSPKALNPSL